MIAFLTALPSFISALPYLFSLATQVMGLVEKIVAWAEKNEFHKWMEDLELKIDTLEKAKTPDEKRAAASGISDVLKSLG